VARRPPPGPCPVPDRVVPPLALALYLTAALLPACTGSRTAIDWDRIQAEGRLVARPLGLKILRGEQPHDWGDGIVRLRAVSSGLFQPGHRLVTTVTGATGNATPFLLDTGSDGSYLSTTAPLAAEARISRMPFRVAQGRRDEGYLGYLPEAHLGTLAATNLALGLIEKEHTPKQAANVLGFRHLFSTQMEHERGRWRLRSGRFRRAAADAGWIVVRLVRGLPLVRVRCPDGEFRYALIDTGANASVAVAPSPEGEYTLLAENGSHVLDISVRFTVDWRGLNIGGREIAVLIGMDALAGRDWRLTLDQGVWAFPPAE